MKHLPVAGAIALLALSPLAGAAVTSTFAEIPLAADSHYYPQASASFSSGAASFNHEFTDWGGGFTSWSGWTVSNEHDTTTAGYLNQFSVFNGGGQGDGGSFAVAYAGAPAAVLDTAALVQGAWFANTTYAALSMLQGDSFAKKFGGATGEDPDWLRLTIIGRNGALATGAVDFYLADYRSADNASDYIVDDWIYVDLTPLNTLGAPTRLEFVLTSSDTGPFGMNTPAYFAMDNLNAVPIPGSVFLLASGLLALLGFRRKESI